MDLLTLTVAETAKVLGISRNLAYQLVRQGDIPSLRLGRRIVVPRAALERLLDEGPGRAAEEFKARGPPA